MPPDHYGNENIFENPTIKIKTVFDYKGRPYTEVSTDNEKTYAPLALLSPSQKDLIKTIREHTIKELNPALYEKPKPPRRTTTP